MEFEKIKKEFIVNEEEYSKEQLGHLMSKLLNKFIFVFLFLLISVMNWLMHLTSVVTVAPMDNFE